MDQYVFLGARQDVFPVVYVAGHHFGHTIMLHNKNIKIIYHVFCFVKKENVIDNTSRDTTYFLRLLRFYSIGLVRLLKLNSYCTTHKE